MRRRLDGLLLLDKPVGVSSSAALQEARRLYRARKAGHAGTLDPLASGLLPVLFGEATKFSQYLLDAEKEYLAEAQLGATTTTGDAEGEVLERRAVRVDDEAIERALAAFRGEIMQVPPMHSALKRGGRPLYRLAREGKTVERAPRRVQVLGLELLRRSEDRLALRIRCSKGTYVRTLVADLGEALGTGAYLAALRRVAAGRWSVGQAVTLAELAAAPEAGRERHVRPLDALLEPMPRVTLDSASARRFAQGQTVVGDGGSTGCCRVYAEDGRLLGVGERAGGAGLRPVRLLATG
jgi:tRNA pseudouridine55 synthase